MQRKLLAWGRDNFSDFPWRHENNLFHALVAEILLQRTRAEQVVPVYREFVTQFPDPVSLGEASVSQIAAMIAPLGLTWRAKLLPELGKKLRVQQAVPMDIHSLCNLPGVGPYVATAFLSLHYRRRASIVDSNIVRFYGRFFGFNTGSETRRNKMMLELAEYVTPERKYRDFNYALIDFTRTICRPKPRCNTCVLRRKCCYQSYQ